MTQTNRRWQIERLLAPSPPDIEGLASVLVDCVDGDASVSFMFPLPLERAVAFWTGVAADTVEGKRALLVARDDEGICATVQLVMDQPENQPHRAELAKMLVHRRARRQGLGAALLDAVHETARECGKTLLVLDTVDGGAAERVYQRAGWTRVGSIPGYALMPRGGLVTTVVYYRTIGEYG